MEGVGQAVRAADSPALSMVVAAINSGDRLGAGGDRQVADAVDEVGQRRYPALGAPVQHLRLLDEHPLVGVGQLDVPLQRAEQADPTPQPRIGIDRERGDRAAGGTAAGLRVGGLFPELPFIEEPLLGELNSDVDERRRHLVGQTLEVVGHLDAVAMLEVHEVQVVEHDQPGFAAGDTVDGQRTQLGGRRPVDGGVAVELQDLLVQTLQRDAGAERDERHRQPLMPT